MIHSQADHVSPDRLRVAILVFCVVLLAIVARLAYWQLIKGPELRVEAKSQYEKLVISRGRRGSIKTADGYVLATTEQRYRLFAQPHILTESPAVVASKVAPVVLDVAGSDPSLSAAEALQQVIDDLTLRMSKPGAKWSVLLSNLSEEHRQKIKELSITGIGTEPYFAREYPEASMAAQILGFVGKTDDGEDIGYFGIEGALNRELTGQLDQRILPGVLPGLRLPSALLSTRPQDGRHITLTIRRDLQYLAERNLAYGMERYGASSGEIIIMEPGTGKILALATSPSYSPQKFAEAEPQLYKNPSIAAGYEPGSTLKTLTVAAGIDAGVISPNTACPVCSGPREIAGYTLKTWNNQYTPGITMTEAIAKSDNTAMIYISDLLGSERLQKYWQNFGIGKQSGIELQEDSSPPFPSKWGPVELATRSFGQGVSTTSMQVIKAVNAIANQGRVVRPTLVASVSDDTTGEVMQTDAVIESQAITPETARQVTQMMVYAAQKGEAQWTASNDHWVAAKTGTSQIATAGGYVSDKTIASFIGFAPPDNPKFIMLVKLVEPSTSPWAAETAAPLWYRMARQVFLILNIPPDKVATPADEAKS